MFKSLKIMTLQVNDLEKAGRWYKNILNRQPVMENPHTVIFNIGNTSLTIVPVPDILPCGAGRVSVYWEVDDIYDSYRSIIENGASPYIEIKTFPGVRIAQVVDPFGNIVGLAENVNDTEERDAGKNPSETAAITAYYRALSSKDEREGIRGKDYLAEIFLSEESKKSLNNADSRKTARRMPGFFYGYLIARTAFIDDIFEKALRDDIRQVVFIGAGYDTRPYRFRHLTGNTKIFELDTGIIQKRKRELLEKASVPLPDRLTFAPVNLQNDDIQTILFEAGFDRNRKALFICEGLFYYLEKQVAGGILDFISLNSPPGSAVVFDMIKEKINSININEPVRFWLERNGIDEFIREKNFKIGINMDAEDLEDKYLKINGVLQEKSMQEFYLVLLTLAGR